MTENKSINYDDGFGSKLTFDDELAYRWAPVFTQFTKSDSLESDIGFSADFLTRVNYDGDWIGNNNWDNLNRHKNNLPASVYYWGYEENNYTVLGYMTYHPRDWSDQIVDIGHENDAEGVFIFLKLNKNMEYVPLVISTLAHRSLYHYALNQTDVTGINGLKRIERKFSLDSITNSPKVYIEAMGHGVYASLDQIHQTSSSIRYSAAMNSDRINSQSGNTTASYNLIPIKQLWDQRYNEDLFFKSGYFKSDNSGTCGIRTLALEFCRSRAAAPPWVWHQNQQYSGEVWYQPLLFYKLLLQLT